MTLSTNAQGSLFFIGACLLYVGADWLVRGSSRLARAAGIGPLVVGLTVVAFGTSAPELVVSVLAAARGSPEVAIGNVVGSNVLNLGLIVGLAAVIRALPVTLGLILRESPLMVLAALSLPVLAWDGGLSRADGGVLVACFAAYIAFVVLSAKREPGAVVAEFAENQESGGIPARTPGTLRDVGLVAIGIATLVLGAQLLVGAAVHFARVAGVSELVVGLTVVAVGTSLPELATSVVATLRGESDIALGNAVGSNVFNSLAILGIAALVRPTAVDPSLLRFEIPVMVGISVLFPLLVLTRRRVGRIEGLVLLAAYFGFTAALVMRALD